MIQLLNSAHELAVRELLERAPAYNIYMLSNLSTLGFGEPFCEFWGDFDEAGALRAVLNRYMRGWALYGTAEADWAALGRVIDQHATDANRLQDNPGGTASLLPHLHTYEAAHVFPEEFMILDKAAFAPTAPPPGVELRRATMDDLDELAAFYTDAEKMARTRAAVEQPLQHRRVWVAEMGGTIVASALTNAESAGMAMVGGVVTAPDRRGHGISKALCSALCAELMAEGWQPVLYWVTPAAGAVYRRLGFQPIGVWRSVHLQRKPGAPQPCA